MLTIYKYKLEIVDEIIIDMPRGARPLGVQTQGVLPLAHSGLPYVWAMVDTTAPVVRHRFALRGTGHDCAGLDVASYVGTFQLQSGVFVGHLFDLGET
jgi:hypothetical protein